MPTNTPGPVVTVDFYDRLAPFYHLIYPDWNASTLRQGDQLGALIEAHWPGRRTLLDVSCGTGTQAIALALRGYRGRNLVKPCGVRVENGTRTLRFQVWEFDGDQLCGASMARSTSRC